MMIPYSDETFNLSLNYPVSNQGFGIRKESDKDDIMDIDETTTYISPQATDRDLDRYGGNIHLAPPPPMD